MKSKRFWPGSSRAPNGRFYDRILIHSLARSVTHSLSHSLTRLLARSLTHSVAYSLTRSLGHSLTRSLTHSLARSLARSLTHSLTYSLTRLLARSLTQSLTYSLTHMHAPTNIYVNLHNRNSIRNGLSSESETNRKWHMMVQSIQKQSIQVPLKQKHVNETIHEHINN